MTRNYPGAIAEDASRWLRAFKRQKQYRDTVGVIAAWAADEDLLGQVIRVNRYLAQQAKAGHLNTPLGPVDTGAQQFIAKLQRFLRARGYLR